MVPGLRRGTLNIMDKQFILDEIRRTAEENGGLPLGMNRFKKETGVAPYSWLKHWARWSDAVREAGFRPNRLASAFPDDTALAGVAAIIRELGRVPKDSELRLRHRTDPAVPSQRVLRRIGPNRQVLISRLVEYCKRHPGLEDVLAICSEYPAPAPEPAAAEEMPILGEVYLIRSGRSYKIGRSVSAGRRTRELQIQLPERANRVHAIQTDDPVGIERYWHERFADKRGNGEWFKLDASDVSAFRRRKFM